MYLGWNQVAMRVKLYATFQTVYESYSSAKRTDLITIRDYPDFPIGKHETFI